MRKVLASISQTSDKATDAVRELLKKYGAEKLSAIDESKLPSLLSDANNLMKDCENGKYD